MRGYRFHSRGAARMARRRNPHYPHVGAAPQRGPKIRMQAARSSEDHRRSTSSRGLRAPPPMTAASSRDFPSPVRGRSRSTRAFYRAFAAGASSTATSRSSVRSRSANAPRSAPSIVPVSVERRAGGLDVATASSTVARSVTERFRVRRAAGRFSDQRTRRCRCGTRRARDGRRSVSRHEEHRDALPQLEWCVWRQRYTNRENAAVGGPRRVLRTKASRPQNVGNRFH